MLNPSVPRNEAVVRNLSKGASNGLLTEVVIQAAVDKLLINRKGFSCDRLNDK